MILQIDREEALETIGTGVLDWLRDCCEQAWSVYHNRIAQELPDCEPPALASLIRQLILAQIRRTHREYDGVSLKLWRHNRRFLVQVGDRLVIQVKKLTEDLRTSNLETRTSRAFDQQQLIEGYPQVPRLTLGYKLGAYRTELSEVLLIFSIDNECQWWYDLRSGEHSQELHFPLLPEPDEDRQAKGETGTGG